jgi:uncharacterized protein YutE (UPF0331/DUF86 family)
MSGRNQPVPETMGQAFAELAAESIFNKDISGKMRKTVDIRNIAIHSYEEIYWVIGMQLQKESALILTDSQKRS